MTHPKGTCTRSMMREQEQIKLISRHRLVSKLWLNYATGVFTWKEHHRSNLVNKQAGCESNGYWKIGINRRSYFAHRLAWLYIYGEWPSGCIDHIDGDRLNNSIDNLRVADLSVNNSNRSVLQGNNTSGLTGVAYHRTHKKWQSSVYANGKRKYLGTYETKEEAFFHYAMAAREVGKTELHIFSSPSARALRDSALFFQYRERWG